MEIQKDNINILNDIMNKYGLSIEEKNELLSIIKEIFYHDEFQKRMTNKYKHHREITLGYHILQTTIVTYLFYKKTNKKFDLDIALKIAMLHDLYTSPWTNDLSSKSLDFKNNHGINHPIEAVINANVWYSQIFENKIAAEKIIDGIVHHMYPFPVSRFINDGINSLNLKNYEYISSIKNLNLNILERSSNKGVIYKLSLKKSDYIEGRIVSVSDKLVSITNFSNLNVLNLFISGYNKNLEEINYKYLQYPK